MDRGMAVPAMRLHGRDARATICAAVLKKDSDHINRKMTELRSKNVLLTMS
jgi:hypothetical protein